MNEEDIRADANGAYLTYRREYLESQRLIPISRDVSPEMHLTMWLEQQIKDAFCAGYRESHRRLLGR